MAYLISLEDDGIYVQFTRIFSFVENFEAVEKMIVYSKRNKANYVIWDLMNVSHFVMSDNEAAMLASICKGVSTNSNGIKLVLLGKGDYAELLCNTFIQASQQLHIPWDFSLFDNIDDAKRYLHNSFSR